MFDFVKAFWEKVSSSGGGFTPKGIVVRLGISVAASLIASIMYATFIRSDDANTQSVTEVTVLVPMTSGDSTPMIPATATPTTPATSTTLIVTTTIAPNKTTAAAEFVSPIASNPKDGLYLLNDILKPKDWSKTWLAKPAHFGTDGKHTF